MDNGTSVQPVPLKQCIMLNSGGKRNTLGELGNRPGQPVRPHLCFRDGGMDTVSGSLNGGAKAMAEQGDDYKQILALLSINTH